MTLLGKPALALNADGLRAIFGALRDQLRAAPAAWVGEDDWVLPPQLEQWLARQWSRNDASGRDRR
jgi:hypothetical protein